jgi:hypothetical protein
VWLGIYLIISVAALVAAALLLHVLPKGIEKSAYRPARPGH